MMGIRRNKTLVEQAVDYVEHKVEQAKPHVEQAVGTARERAVPLMHEARDKAGPKIAEARDKAKPLIADGTARAAEKAAAVAEVASQKASESRDLAAAKVAAVKGETPKKKHRLRKLLVFSGLAAAAAYVAGKLKGRQEDQNWQSSYTPSPPPAPPAPAPAAPTAPADDSTNVSDDVGGSSPDEALADATDEPHDVTTPDDPVEEVALDEDAPSKN
ncbi:MAG: hypothetical protein ACRDO4_10215 [Nocardioides sp.]